MTNRSKRGLYQYEAWEKHGQQLVFFYRSRLHSDRMIEISKYRNDLAHGKIQNWGPDGKLIQTGRHRRGNPVGIWVVYDSQGALIHKKRYARGGGFIEEKYQSGMLLYRKVIRHYKRDDSFTSDTKYLDKDGNEVSHHDCTKWSHKLRTIVSQKRV